MVDKPAGEGHPRLRRLGHRDGGSGSSVVRERERDPFEPITIEEFLNLRTIDDAGRAVTVACHRKVPWTDLSECGLTGKEFQARFFGSKPCREAGQSTDSIPGVLEFLRGEDPEEVLLGCLAKQTFYARDLDGVNAAARPGTRVVHHPSPLVSRGSQEQCGGCAVVDTARVAQAGSSSRRVAIPGTSPCRSESRANTVSRIPEAAKRCPKAHLKAVVGGGFVPKIWRIADASDASDGGVPFPWATIIPTSAGPISASSSARTIARTSPSPSVRIERSPSPSATQALPRNSPRTFAPRARAAAAVSRTSAAAPSPKRVPLRALSKGRIVSAARRPSAWK